MNANRTCEEGRPELNDERLELGVRASPRQLFLIQQAAALGGKTLAEFMVASAEARAEYVLVNQSRLVLNQASLGTIVEALAGPACACPRLSDLLQAKDAAHGPPVVEELHRGLDLAAFDCGYPELNDWLLHLALPGQFMRCVNTYVARADRSVMGFYAVGVKTLAVDLPPGSSQGAGHGTFPQALSAMILLRLAVDTRRQNRGLGRWLLQDAIRRFASEAASSTSAVLFIQAKNQRVRQLYLNSGFTPLPSEDLVLFLTRKNVMKTLENY